MRARCAVSASPPRSASPRCPVFPRLQSKAWLASTPRRGRWWWRRRPRPRTSFSACMPRSRISWCSRRSRNTPSRWACSRSTRPRSPACASSCRRRSRDGAKSWNRPESPARNETQDATFLPNRARHAPRAGGQIWGTAMSAPLLSVRGVKAYYGHIAALRGVDVDVGEGEIVSLIGANGAGKSTLMMTIFGNPRAREGHILFAGRDITQLPTHEIARLKIAQAPEGRRIFVRMTVMENLQMGAAVADAADFQADVERVFALFPRLKERLDQRGGTLSGGEQQMLAIGRALMGQPRLLLLDEPSLGLAPLIARQIFDAIRKLNSEEKLTVFLVEQNAFHALKLAHRGYVMVNGRITLSGTGRELLARPEVKAAYLEGGRR